MDMMYNKQGNRLTFAWPIGATMAELFDKIGWFDKVLALVSYLVALVATGSILASIYNSMNERRREIAILRALGARRRIIFSAILLEAAAISTLGMVVAFVFYLAIMTGAAAVIRAQTGIVLDPFALNPVMLWAPVALIALGALSGIVPAIKAYRTDVAEHLAPISNWQNIKPSNTPNDFHENIFDQSFRAGAVLWRVAAMSKTPLPETPHLHVAVPPHGGNPVALGDDYQIEWVLDAPAGKLQAYVLDGEMENFVRITLPSFDVTAKLPDGEEVLHFVAVANTATGEKVGSTACSRRRRIG